MPLSCIVFEILTLINTSRKVYDVDGGADGPDVTNRSGGPTDDRE